MYIVANNYEDAKHLSKDKDGCQSFGNLDNAKQYILDYPAVQKFIWEYDGYVLKPVSRRN